MALVVFDGSLMGLIGFCRALQGFLELKIKVPLLLAKLMGLTLTALVVFYPL